MAAKRMDQESFFSLSPFFFSEYKGRRKQNELRLNIDFRMANTNKWELVVFENTLIDKPTFEGYKEDKSKKATYMPAYNPEFWSGYNIMEPNQAIKEFTVSSE